MKREVKEYTGYFLWSIGFVIILVVISFILNYAGLIQLEIFGVKKADVRREIFEQSKSYNFGMVNDLAKYYDEYRATDEDGKKAIRGIIKARFANFDAEKIQVKELKQFLIKQRGF